MLKAGLSALRRSMRCSARPQLFISVNYTREIIQGYFRDGRDFRASISARDKRGRLRANNVIDVAFDKAAIVAAIRETLHDPGFRARHV
jgi:hypothetical protein